MPKMSVDQRRASDQAERIGREVATRVIDKLRADPKKGRRSAVWKLPRDILIRAVILHCLAHMDCTTVYDELKADLAKDDADAKMVPLTNFRRWMVHAREIHDELSHASFTRRVMIDKDYLPADGNVDIMAETLGVNIYQHAMHLLRGGDDGLPPTKDEMRIINRALDTLASISAGSASAERKRAQARLDTMKAEKLKRSLESAMQHSRQSNFSTGDVMKLIDGVLAGGVEVEEAIKSQAGAKGGGK